MLLFRRTKGLCHTSIVHTQDEATFFFFSIIFNVRRFYFLFHIFFSFCQRKFIKTLVHNLKMTCVHVIRVYCTHCTWAKSIVYQRKCLIYLFFFFLRKCVLCETETVKIKIFGCTIFGSSMVYSIAGNWSRESVFNSLFAYIYIQKLSNTPQVT